MEISRRSRDGSSAQKYTWDEDRAGRNMEPLHSIQEGTDKPSSSGRRPGTKHSQSWPFHRHAASEVTSIRSLMTGHLRLANWAPKSFLRSTDDSNSLESSGVVPDYIVNYIRGETPETLAKKREQRSWGRKGVVVTPQRERFYSTVLDVEDAFGSSTNLTPNAYANEVRQRGCGRFLLGWRGGVLFNLVLAFLILVAAVVCFVLAVLRSKVLLGETTLFTGSCNAAANINMGLHVAINVFTITLLAGANYIFHVLSSPTRFELAKAHKSKQWLDIGIPSLRNLEHISGFRVPLATILLLTAVATQVIYNSVIFIRQSGLDLDVLFVTESFLGGASFSNATDVNEGALSRLEIVALQDSATQNKLVNLTWSDCLQEFGGSFETTFDAVLVVTDNATTSASLVQTGKSAILRQVGEEKASSNDKTALDGSLVKYCLARDGVEQTCSVAVSRSMLGIVALLNVVTVIGVAVVLALPQFEPLVTVGDAIRSFLRVPDITTVNSCLMTKADILNGRWGHNNAKSYDPANHLWLTTPSLARWILTFFSWLMLVAPTGVFMGIVMPTDPKGLASPFGVATPYTTFQFPVSVTRTEMMLIAALPQLLLGILYLSVNALLTTYFLSHEFSLFALGPRPLRVSSDPIGAQTTSLYLTLPRPVSWFLLIFFAGLGFVLSQTIFPAIIDISSSSSSSPIQTEIIAVALSSQALLVFLGLLVLLAIFVLALGFRSAPAAGLSNGEQKGNPLALKGGSCSAAISARCQPLPIEEDVWKLPVAWGVTNEAVGFQVGHCAFSALSVGNIDVGHTYA